MSSYRDRQSHPLIAAGLLLALFVAPLAAKEMTAREAKKVVNEAKGAAQKGDGVKARELYQLVIASSAKAPKSRIDALYYLVLLEATKPAAQRDGALFDRSLTQLVKEIPKDDERNPQVAALAGVLKDYLVLESEVAELKGRLAASEAKLKEYEESTAASSRDSGKKLEDTEARARRLQNEVDKLKAELAKQEEALKKLKKVVVGGG